MKKKQLVCSALAAAMMLSTAAPGASAARFSDSAGHWSESSIDRWSDAGVIVGTDSAFNPDGSITRGEMATILAEMLGLEQRADNTYPDLNGGWYTDAMLKCAAAGIMTGDDHGQMRPYDNVTGVEIAVILSKALDLSSSKANYPTTPSGYVKPWGQSYVDAITKRGIAVGNQQGTFEPMQPTSRAAFVTMLDRAVDTYISSPGTYTADGLTVINTDGTVTLKGTPSSIKITESSTGATVKLDHTNVSGTILLEGSRIRLTGDHATMEGDLQVRGNGNTITLDGTTSAGTVQLSTNATSSSVTVGAAARAGSIRTDATSTTVNVSGSVNNIVLESNAASSGVNVRSGGRVENLTSNANNVTVSGNGTLRVADIYGSNNRVTTPNTTVNSSVSTNPSNSVKNGVRVANKRPYRYSASDRCDVNFYLNDGSSTRFASSRVYYGDRVADPGIPERAGAYVFDCWKYERYYYGYDYWYDWDYYTHWRDYYDWDYWYDWDRWYKCGDWKWDSSEKAYYNREADVYYDPDGGYYYYISRSVRHRLNRSEVSDRYGKYYNWGYWYKDLGWYRSSDWTWSSYWDAYYNKAAGIYYNEKEDRYFDIVNGDRRTISHATAFDRLNGYYYGYYYKGDYPERYWYSYRHGETFNFSDKIYGDVDLYAQWKSATLVSDLSTITGSGVYKFSAGGTTTYTNLTIPSGAEVHIPSGISIVVTGNYVNNGKVVGPGTIRKGTATDTALQNLNTALGTPTTSGGVTASLNSSTKTYTISFPSDVSLDSTTEAELKQLAQDLIDAATKSGYTMYISGTNTKATADVIVAMLKANAKAVVSRSAVMALLEGSGTLMAAEGDAAESTEQKVSSLGSVRLDMRDANGTTVETVTVAVSVKSSTPAQTPAQKAEAEFANLSNGVTLDAFKTAYNKAVAAAGEDAKVTLEVGGKEVALSEVKAGNEVTVKIDGKVVKTITLQAAEQTAAEKAAAAFADLPDGATLDAFKTAYNKAVTAAGSDAKVTLEVDNAEVPLDEVNAGDTVTVKVDGNVVKSITLKAAEQTAADKAKEELKNLQNGDTLDTFKTAYNKAVTAAGSDAKVTLEVENIEVALDAVNAGDTVMVKVDGEEVTTITLKAEEKTAAQKAKDSLETLSGTVDKAALSAAIEAAKSAAGDGSVSITLRVGSNTKTIDELENDNSVEVLVNGETAATVTFKATVAAGGETNTPSTEDSTSSKEAEADAQLLWVETQTKEFENQWFRSEMTSGELRSAIDEAGAAGWTVRVSGSIETDEYVVIYVEDVFEMRVTITDYQPFEAFTDDPYFNEDIVNSFTEDDTFTGNEDTGDEVTGDDSEGEDFFNGDTDDQEVVNGDEDIVTVNWNDVDVETDVGGGDDDVDSDIGGDYSGDDYSDDMTFDGGDEFAE